MSKKIEIRPEETRADVVALAKEYGLTPEQLQRLKHTMAEYLLLDDFLEKTSHIKYAPVNQIDVLWQGWFAEWATTPSRPSYFKSVYRRNLQTLVSMGRKGRQELVELGHPFMTESSKKKRGFRR